MDAAAEQFPHQVWELVGHLDGTLPGDHPGRGERLRLAAQFSADELIVLTITGDYQTRLESYERLAQAFAPAA